MRSKADAHAVHGDAHTRGRARRRSTKAHRILLFLLLLWRQLEVARHEPRCVWAEQRVATRLGRVLGGERLTQCSAHGHARAPRSDATAAAAITAHVQ